ncbi:MAG: hypothetical protein ACWGOY_08685 [Anaerolineales bacterium]
MSPIDLVVLVGPGVAEAIFVGEGELVEMEGSAEVLVCVKDGEGALVGVDVNVVAAVALRISVGSGEGVLVGVNGDVVSCVRWDGRAGVWVGDVPGLQATRKIVRTKARLKGIKLTFVFQDSLDRPPASCNDDLVDFDLLIFIPEKIRSPMLLSRMFRCIQAAIV